MKQKTDRIVSGVDVIIKTVIDKDNKDEKLYSIKQSLMRNILTIIVEVKDKNVAGLLIGRAGYTASTIRKLVEIIAKQENIRVSFSIYAWSDADEWESHDA